MIGGILSGLVDKAFNSAQSNLEYQRAKESASTSYRRNIANQHMVQQMNSVASQRADLIKAGINPATLSSSNSGVSAQPAPMSSTPTENKNSHFAELYNAQQNLDFQREKLEYDKENLEFRKYIEEKTEEYRKDYLGVQRDKNEETARHNAWKRKAGDDAFSYLQQFNDRKQTLEEEKFEQSKVEQNRRYQLDFTKTYQDYALRYSANERAEALYLMDLRAKEQDYQHKEEQRTEERLSAKQNYRRAEEEINLLLQDGNLKNISANRIRQECNRIASDNGISADAVFKYVNTFIK